MHLLVSLDIFKFRDFKNNRQIGKLAKPPKLHLLWETQEQNTRERHLIAKMNTTCCCSVTQPCPTLCDPMYCSIPGLPVLHHLPKFAQVHVHCMGDAIQSSYPLILLLLLPSVFPSIRDFSNELAVYIRRLQHHIRHQFSGILPPLWSSSHNHT